MTLLTIDLRTDAIADAARLSLARALTRSDVSQACGGFGDDVTLAQLEGDAAWILPARSPALRRALNGRALLLWRISCEDGNGRTVESRLIAVAAALSGDACVGRRAALTTLVRAMESEASEMVERSCEDWRIAVERTTRAFGAARAARLRAIAMKARDTVQELRQAGLFDRRSARLTIPTAPRSDAITLDSTVRVRSRLRLVLLP